MDHTAARKPGRPRRWPCLADTEGGAVQSWTGAMREAGETGRLPNMSTY